MKIIPNNPNSDFVCFVEGVDISKGISLSDSNKIDKLINKYAVVVFRDQLITDEQQIEFTELFGKIEKPGNNSSVQKGKDRRLSSKMADVSNITKSSTVNDRNDPTRIFNLGNRLWHSDSSYKKIPAKYSLLSARTVAKKGGNTEFADMRAAYDKLDKNLKATIKDMVCEHSLIYSRQRLGFDMKTELSDREYKNFTPVLQPLLRIIPMTKRKLIYLSSHIGKIRGWLREDSMCFINDLMEHATAKKFVYIHKWKKNDLVIWDNRQVMHRVRHFDDTKEYRDMRRTTILGEEKLN